MKESRSISSSIASPEARQQMRSLAMAAAQLVADRRCEDVRLVDLAGISQICDYMLIASGTSQRQMKSIASEVADLAKQQNVAVFRRSSDDGHTWVVLDLVDLVVHLFEPNLRSFYDLDALWGGGTLLDWRRADQQDTHRCKGPIGLAMNSDDDDEEDDFDSEDED
ncbi:MAG: ribosome silencing factor [Phycisphaerales bacterium]